MTKNNWRLERGTVSAQSAHSFDDGCVSLRVNVYSVYHDRVVLGADETRELIDTLEDALEEMEDE